MSKTDCENMFNDKKHKKLANNALNLKKCLIVYNLDSQDTAIQIYSLGISSSLRLGISKPRECPNLTAKDDPHTD